MSKEPSLADAAARRMLIALAFVFLAAACDKPADKPTVVIENLSNDTLLSEYPSMACDNEGRVSVAWSDFRSGKENIWLVEKPPGWEWLQPVNLSQTDAGARYVSMCYDAGGTLHAIWQQFVYGRDGGTWALVYRFRARGGSWQAPETVWAGVATAPVACIDSLGTLHVVFNDWTGLRVAYVSRAASGVWTAPVRLSANVVYADAALCVSPHGECVAAWEQEDASYVDAIMYARKDSAGNWTAPEQLLSTTTTLLQRPRLVWADNGPRMLYSGGTSKTPLVLADHVTGQGWIAAETVRVNGIVNNKGLALDTAGKAVAVWTLPGGELWLACERDDWQATLLCDDPVERWPINIAVGPDGQVHLAWQQGVWENADDIYYALVTW